MAVLVVPSLDEEPWPTLGPQVCDLLEDRCVHGPGDLKGRPLHLDDDKRALIYKAYEVFPKNHPRAGRRRFKRVAWSLRKGTAKTETAAALMFAELHPEGPVRCDGWRKDGGVWVPVGRPVADPYIPMVAYTEEQTEELAYGALYVMCGDGPDANLFDVGLDRILRLNQQGRPDGKAVALAAAPDSRDGARTTCQHFDEPHRMTSHRLREAHETMLENIPKRTLADGWSLETTTAYAPGEGSVAQDTHEYAEQIDAGKAEDPAFFFFHREAAPDPEEDLDDPEQRRDKIREASGPAIGTWEGFEDQVEGVASLYTQAKARGNAQYWERVWLNRRVQGARKAFDAERWRQLAVKRDVPRREQISLGLDGSRFRDATAVIATHIDTGWQWPLNIWERPSEDDAWEVPEDEVEALIHEGFAGFKVTRLYGDPAQGWDMVLARLAGRYGPKRVVEFWTDSRNLKRTAQMCRSYAQAIATGGVTHSGDEQMARHIGAAHKRDTHMKDEFGEPLWVMEKERRDSPFKIDGAMAGALSWKARLDTIAAGDATGDRPSAPLDPSAHTRATDRVLTSLRW